MNENTEQNPKRPPQPQTGDALRKKKVQGKAFHVNENSEEDQPTSLPAPAKRE